MLLLEKCVEESGSSNKKEKARGKKIQFSFICIPHKGGKGSNSWEVVIGKRIQEN